MTVKFIIASTYRAGCDKARELGLPTSVVLTRPHQLNGVELTFDNHVVVSNRVEPFTQDMRRTIGNRRRRGDG